MSYRNLEDIIKTDSRGRAYFQVLPMDVQKELLDLGGYIHTTDELHAHARFAEAERRKAILSHRNTV